MALSNGLRSLILSLEKALSGETWCGRIGTDRNHFAQSAEIPELAARRPKNQEHRVWNALNLRMRRFVEVVVN